MERLSGKTKRGRYPLLVRDSTSQVVGSERWSMKKQQGEVSRTLMRNANKPCMGLGVHARIHQWNIESDLFIVSPLPYLFGTGNSVSKASR